MRDELAALNVAGVLDVAEAVDVAGLHAARVHVARMHVLVYALQQLFMLLYAVFINQRGILTEMLAK